MSDLEIIAIFDTPQTARSCAKLLDAWFTWIMEGSDEDIEKMDNMFNDFGLEIDDFSIDRDTDIDWGEIPEVHVEGNKIVVALDSKTGVDTIRQLFEAMGAYDVSSAGEDD